MRLHATLALHRAQVGYKMLRVLHESVQTHPVFSTISSNGHLSTRCPALPRHSGSQFFKWQKMHSTYFLPFFANDPICGFIGDVQGLLEGYWNLPGQTISTSLDMAILHVLTR